MRIESVKLKMESGSTQRLLILFVNFVVLHALRVTQRRPAVSLPPKWRPLQTSAILRSIKSTATQMSEMIKIILTMFSDVSIVSSAVQNNFAASGLLQQLHSNKTTTINHENRHL
jgi:hypothetical protein